MAIRNSHFSLHEYLKMPGKTTTRLDDNLEAKKPKKEK